MAGVLLSVRVVLQQRLVDLRGSEREGRGVYPVTGRSGRAAATRKSHRPYHEMLSLALPPDAYASRLRFTIDRACFTRINY